MFKVQDIGTLVYDLDTEQSLFRDISILLELDLSKVHTILENLPSFQSDSQTILNELGRMSLTQLKNAGFTPNQAEKITAAFRLSSKKGLTVNSPGSVASHLIEQIGHFEREVIAVVVLTVIHDILATEIITVGALDETLCPPSEVFRAVLRHGGARFILAHNHPSGNATPSTEDIALTKQIMEGSKILGIPMLDHLVITKDSFTSIRTVSFDIWDN